MKSLTYGNQAYSLALYDKVTDPVVFYYQIDEVSARVAAEEATKARICCQIGCLWRFDASPYFGIT